MTERSKQRRRIQRTGVVTLLAAGAMVLSGCWGLVVGPDESGKKAVVLNERFTNQIVYTHCGGTTSDAAARCALDAVGRLCTDHPLKNMSAPDCIVLGWPSPGQVREMKNALWQVIYTSDVCLVGYFGTVREWAGSPRGFACG